MVLARIWGRETFSETETQFVIFNSIQVKLAQTYSGPSRLLGGRPTEYRPHLGHP